MFERARDQIDLLLCDVAMPRVTGPELAVEFVRKKPGLAVLLMSGCVAEAEVEEPSGPGSPSSPSRSAIGAGTKSEGDSGLA